MTPVPSDDRQSKQGPEDGTHLNHPEVSTPEPVLRSHEFSWLALDSAANQLASVMRSPVNDVGEAQIFVEACREPARNLSRLLDLWISSIEKALPKVDRNDQDSLSIVLRVRELLRNMAEASNSDTFDPNRGTDPLTEIATKLPSLFSKTPIKDLLLKHAVDQDELMLQRLKALIRVTKDWLVALRVNAALRSGPDDTVIVTS